MTSIRHMKTWDKIITDINFWHCYFWRVKSVGGGGGVNRKYPKLAMKMNLNDTLIIPHKNTLIEIEPHLFSTKTANWGSIVLKVFLVYSVHVWRNSRSVYENTEY